MKLYKVICSFKKNNIKLIKLIQNQNYKNKMKLYIVICSFLKNNLK